jgi:protein-S-isoprenylcysteine O-methyltransferase Ste14
MISLENDPSVVIICWIIFLLYWFVSAFFVKKSVTKINWRLQILWRVAVIAIVIILIKLDKNGSLAFIKFILQSPFHFAIIGSVITVLGLAGAIWARITLGRNWSGYVTYKEDQDLVTNGPYRFVRHPIYTSMIVMFIGSFLYYGSPIIAIGSAIAVVVFILRTRKEEAIMIDLFGDKYTEYMKRTKRLIPFVY